MFPVAFGFIFVWFGEWFFSLCFSICPVVLLLFPWWQFGKAFSVKIFWSPTPPPTHTHTFFSSSPCHPTPRRSLWSPGEAGAPSVPWSLPYLVPWHFLVIWYVFVPESNKHSLSFFPLSFCVFLWLWDVGLFVVGPAGPLSLEDYPHITRNS